MTVRRHAAWKWVWGLAAAVPLVGAIDQLTNQLDVTRFSWDFRYYLDMARRGMEPPLAGPFAYRYVTPLLARVISSALGTEAEAGFAVLARLGAIAQLFGVFLLARWYSKSQRGAWTAMLAVAFSLFQVKYLLFDEFRPDHLAYPLLLLQVYLALTGRFWPLWAVTLVGCQIREFNAIPLAAYVYGMILDGQGGSEAERRSVRLQVAVAAAGLALALIVPRVVIPISEDFQFVSFSRDGILRGLLAPLILARDANFLFALLAYALPVLLLAGPRTLGRIALGFKPFDRHFFGAYCAAVLVLGFLGGTDFHRFMTYLLPIMALLISVLAKQSSNLQLTLVLAAVFVFNKIWLPFPNADLDSFLDFFSGFGTRFNLASILRLLEWILLMAAGYGLRKAIASRRATPMGHSA